MRKSIFHTSRYFIKLTRKGIKWLVMEHSNTTEKHEECKNLVNERQDQRLSCTEDAKVVDIDEYLEYIGQFGKFQILLLLLFILLIMPSTYQTLIMAFVGHNTAWKCVFNSQPNMSLTAFHINEIKPNNNTTRECRYQGDVKISDDNYKARCTMNRSLWEFTRPKEYSIVTDWDLVCDKEYLSYLANSALFIGWGIGAIVFGWISDKYGRKKALFSSWTFLILFAFGSAFVNNIILFIFLRVAIGFCQGGLLTLFVMATELVGPKHRSLAGTAVWFGFTLALCLLGLQAWLVPKWKLLIIITSIPYLILILSYKFVPESLRWLRVNNKISEAIETLQKVAKVNRVVIPDHIQLSSLPHTSEHKKNASFIDLFVPASMGINTLILATAWFVNGQVYYGISLASVDLGDNMYVSFILTSLIELPGNLLSIYTTNRFGRKASVLYSLLLGGLVCVAIAFFPSHNTVLNAIRVALGVFGKLCISHSFNGTTIWSVELYPTVVRAEAMGFLTVVSRIGAASAPWIGQYLQTVHKILPFTIMGGLTIISSLLCFKLKETLGNATAETLVVQTQKNSQDTVYT